MPDTLRVLYVDDEPDLLGICRQSLEENGDFSVGTIDSATGALALLESEQFDAIVSDYQMPGMDGIELLKQVRASGNGIPFILFTGKGREELVIQAINNGADFYLQKGGEPEAQFAELCHKVRIAVQQRRNKESLREKTEELDRFFNSSLDLLCIIDIDGYFRRLNPEWEQTLGHSISDLEGRKFHDFIHPEDLPSTLEAISGLGSREKVLTFVNRCRHRNGSYRWIEWRSYPYGKLIYAAARDITERTLAEEARRESEERNRTILKTAMDGFVLVNTEGQILEVNDAYCRMSGYTPHELRSMNIRDLEAAESADETAIHIRNIMKYGEDRFESQHRRKDGSTYYVEASVQYQPIDGGRLISFLHDITERRQAEAQIRSSRQLLEEVIDNSRFLIYAKDFEGRFILASQSLARFFGQPRDMLLGKTSHDFLPKEIADQHRANDLEVMARESPLHIEETAPADDGDHVFLSTKFPLRDNNGKVYAVCGASVDITGRKRAEEILARRNLQIRNLFENIPIGMFQSTPEGKFVFVNLATATMLGYESTEDLVETVNKTSIPEALYEEPEKRNEFINTVETDRGSWKTFRNRFRKKDGTFIDTLLSFSEYTDPSTGGRNLYGFIQDITDSKRAEETIRNALEEKEVLLREIHHRVKNNLTEIISLIGLQTAAVTDPTVISMFKDLETRIRSMALVHESLYLMKDLSQVNIAAYSDKLTLELFQIYGTSPDIRRRIEMRDITMPIEQALPCGIVISEIVTNSLKYAFPVSFPCQDKRGGPCTITLTLDFENQDYFLTISDNGIGIPQDNGVKRSRTLGLYLIRLIVERQLKGSLEMNTTGGTRYKIRFPKSKV